MPRDSGDDAYEWMAARDRAHTTVKAGSTWKSKAGKQRVTVTNGGFLPTYEADDSRIRYKDLETLKNYNISIYEFLEKFKPT